MTDEKPPQPDRVAFARSVRRRVADHRMAAALHSRGWDVCPPVDEVEEYLRKTRRYTYSK